MKTKEIKDREEEIKKEIAEKPTDTIVDQARAEREKLDATLESMKKENDRTEKLATDRMMEGESTVEKPDEVESPEAYKERIMEGEQ